MIHSLLYVLNVLSKKNIGDKSNGMVSISTIEHARNKKTTTVVIRESIGSRSEHRKGHEQLKAQGEHIEEDKKKNIKVIKNIRKKERIN